MLRSGDDGGGSEIRAYGERWMLREKGAYSTRVYIYKNYESNSGGVSISGVVCQNMLITLC